VAFVASSGGKLPISLAQSKESLELLFLYFNHLADKSDIIINPHLEKIIKSEVNARYLSSFMEMAKRVIFAFDKTGFNNFLDPNYHLVASPFDPLKFDQLPAEIRHVLIETKYDGKLESHLNISLIN
jgi:hypothetical protein